jgi:hypothetical protein
MIISYLLIARSKLVLQDQIPHLFHLIRFGFCAEWLNIDDLFNAVFGENVMTSLDPFIESET